METFVLLDWFVAEFDSRFLKYQLTGDYWIIRRALDASAQGRTLLALMKKPIQQIAKKFELDVDRETVESEPVSGVSTGVAFLSFGIEANEIAETCAIHFIDEILRTKMAMQIPPLTFKLFYLPPLPVATTDEAHIMHRQEGFTGIRTKRIEINVYPPRDFESIFKNIVHEIFHVYYLEESSGSNTKVVEQKVNAHAEMFFDNCGDEWMSNRVRITEDLKNTIEKKLCVFEKVDNALRVLHKEFAKAKSDIQALKELFDAIMDGKVLATHL